jgi:DNA-binding LacI/PurR family transcriptional regulator
VRDLAKKLGVSPMTVSRALSGSAPVDANTRKTVIDAALKAGYRKSDSTPAAPLVLWCGRTLIEIEHRNDVLYHSQILFQARGVLEAHGAQCRLVEHPDENPQDLLAARIIVSNKKKDLAPGGAAACTRIGLDVDNPFGPSVRLDVSQTAELAASRLEALGHRHVAVFSSMEAGHQEERVDAFRRRFTARRGQTMEAVDAREKGPGGTHCLDHFLGHLPRRVTALYAPGGYFALTALEHLAAAGWNVPRQMGVLGFDDFAFYRHLTLEVDRIHADLGLMAEQLVETALRALENGPLSDAVKTLVPAKIIAGKSLLPVSEMDLSIP